MLALTENVTEIVNQLAAEISGLRIAAEADGQSLAISPADQAAQDDLVVEQGGATVYLDAPAAVMLDDKVLDSTRWLALAAQPAGVWRSPIRARARSAV